MSRSAVELTARFIRERHVFLNDGGETRIIIGDVESLGGASLTIKGECEENGLERGLVYRFWGREISHDKYGKQFAFTSFVVDEPADRVAVIAYLKKCRGIGSRVAAKLWDHYEAEAVRMIREEPERVVDEVGGISSKIAKEASEQLSKWKLTEKTKIDVLGLLHGKGFPKKTPDSVIADFGSAAGDVIRRNPYILMRYRGCGFLTTDKLWMELKKNPTKLKRQALCCWSELARDSSGDTWFPVSRIRDGLYAKLAGANVEFEKAKTLAFRGKLLRFTENRGGAWVAEERNARKEEQVARDVAKRIVLGGFDAIDTNSLKGVTEHQWDAATDALSASIGILQGSPGTGKTFTTAQIIKMLLHRGWNADQIAVAAPTGKAAVRVTEAMSKAGLSCLTAKTIHGLLQVESADDGWSFRHDRGNPLPHKFVFIDESSMLDVNLTASLLAACEPTTSILFIGDVNQLAPVGHGAPLRDMIAAGVPCGTLTEIQRNSGRIVKTCAEIRDKRRFSSSEKLDIETGENLYHIEKQTAEEQIEAVEKLLNIFASGNHSSFGDDTIDPVWDVQILCAVNKSSPLNRKDLNRKLQRILNTTQPERGNPFAVRDKIINTKNGWFKSLRPKIDPVNEDGLCYVANGEQANIVEINGGRIVAQLENPSRLISIFRGKQEGGESGSEDDSNTGCSWELGYAISCHKSQGSEWPIVIVLADEHNSARMVCTRNWIYTGISRAKRAALTIGKRKVVEDMICRDAMRRKTFLSELILENVRELQRDLIVGEMQKMSISDFMEGVEYAETAI